MVIKKLHVPREKYLTAGVHIGMTTKTADMKRFIYKIRSNGLAVLNVGMLDEKITYAANMLAKAKNPLIVSKKENGQDAAKKLGKIIEAKVVTGRFMPGSLTNPSYKEFFEPDVIFATDPIADKQVINEAIKMRIPIISLVDTFNDTSYIDLALPANNKGKKSIALIFWIIAKLVAEKKKIKFNAKVEDFGYE